MLSRLVLVFLFVVQTNSLSVLTDDKSQPTTILIRQLLNQETLIRMALDRKVNDLVKSMTEMKNKMITTNEKLQDAKREIQTNNQQLQNAAMEIAALKNENSALKAEWQVQSNVTTLLSDTSIGFTTKLSSWTYSSSSSIIRGDTILYNGGNAYNGTVFTCSSPGLYLFHVSLLSDTVRNGIWIYKNSQQLTLAYSGYDPQYNGASTSAAVLLDVGDQVYLRPYTSPLHVDGNSVFTGVKVN